MRGRIAEHHLGGGPLWTRVFMLDHEELLAGMSHPEALAVLTRCDLSALSSSRGRGRQELAAIPPSRSSCAAIVGARHPDDPDPGHRDAALAALRSRL